MNLNRLFAAVLLALPLLSRAAAPDLLALPLKDIHGKETTLKALNAKAVLVVNVASRCGNTPQYKELQALYDTYREKGLVVVGFPCNDFGAQEPGTNEEILTFCSSRYQVTFPMMDKVVVKGEHKHPLYAGLTGPGAAFPGDVKWNFGKFLLRADGTVAARFEPGVKPSSDAVKAAVEAALASAP